MFFFWTHTPQNLVFKAISGKLMKNEMTGFHFNRVNLILKMPTWGCTKHCFQGSVYTKD